MYLLPKLTHKKLDKQRRTFFWQGGWTKKEISPSEMGDYQQKQKV